MSRILLIVLALTTPTLATPYGVPDLHWIDGELNGAVCVWNLKDSEGRKYHQCRRPTDKEWTIYYDGLQ